jgi:hypothetical protein
MLARAAEINGDGIEGGGGGEGARRWEAVRRRPVDWTSIRLELEDRDIWDASNEEVHLPLAHLNTYSEISEYAQIIPAEASKIFSSTLRIFPLDNRGLGNGLRGNASICIYNKVLQRLTNGLQGKCCCTVVLLVV